MKGAAVKLTKNGRRLIWAIGWFSRILCIVGGYAFVTGAADAAHGSSQAGAVWLALGVLGLMLLSGVLVTAAEEQSPEDDCFGE
jgi:hypothetical protein